MVERVRGGGGVILLPLAARACEEKGETGEVGPGDIPRAMDLGEVGGSS